MSLLADPFGSDPSTEELSERGVDPAMWKLYNWLLIWDQSVSLMAAACSRNALS